MSNPFKKVLEFIKTSSSKRTISVIVLLIIAAAIPLTVIVSQKQQETRQHAAITPVAIERGLGNTPNATSIHDGSPNFDKSVTTWLHWVNDGGVNQVLVVAVSLKIATPSSSASNAPRVTSVTWGGTSTGTGGTALQRLGSFDTTRTADNIRALELWYLVNPTPKGRNYITVRTSKPSSIVAGATTWINVDQANPFGQYLTYFGNGRVPSNLVYRPTTQGLSVGPGDMMIDTMSFDKIAPSTSCGSSIGPNQILAWANNSASVAQTGTYNLPIFTNAAAGSFAASSGYSDFMQWIINCNDSTGGNTWIYQVTALRAAGSGSIITPIITSSTGGSITGYVYSDIGDGVNSGLAGNGQKDPGEPGVSNVRVSLSGQSTASTTTGSDGSYTFSGLALGSYTVSVTPPAGYAISPKDTTSKSVTLTTSSLNGRVDFGLTPAKDPPCYIVDPVAAQLGITSGRRGYGDVYPKDNPDGKITSSDALEVLRIVAGLDNSTPVLLEAGDVNGSINQLSSSIDAVDALHILRFLAGLSIPGAAPGSFPVCPAPTPTPVLTSCGPNGNVVFDNKSSSLTNDASVHRLTWNHTVGTGNNRLLIVGVNLRTSSGGNVTSVRFNNLNLTRIGNQTDFGGISSPTTHNSIWYLLNPPSGTFPIVVTADRSLTISAGASSWFNVDPNNPLSSSVTNVGNDSNPNLSISGPVCGVIVDNLTTPIGDCPQPPSPDSLQTTLWSMNTPGDNLSDQGGKGQSAGSYKQSAEQTTMWWNNSCSGRWALKAVGLVAYGSAPPPTPTSIPTATPVPTATPIPQCTSGQTCTACTASPNTCNGSGTQSCTLTTTSSGSTNCQQVTTNGIFCAGAPPNCTNGNVCVNNACVVPTGVPTATSVPTSPPNATPVPTIPSGNTVFALNIGLDGIGNTGDNSNPNNSSGSNKNPLHPSRNITIQVFNSSDAEVANKSGTLNYSTNTGRFLGNVDMGTLASGNYNVKIKSSGYLRRLVPGIQNVTSGSTFNLPAANLVAGDINGDNAIDILDYNILISCSIFSKDGKAVCNQNQDYKTLADLDDNGAVNQFDYNLFVRELSVQNGD